MENMTPEVQQPQEIPVQQTAPVAPEAPAAPAAPTKNKKLGLILAICIPVLVVAIVAAVFIGISVNKSNQYKEAISLLDDGDIEDAVEIHAELGDYKDLYDQVVEYAIDEFEDELDDGSYKKALDIYEAVVDYPEATDEMDALIVDHTTYLLECENYSTLSEMYSRAKKSGYGADGIASAVVDYVDILLENEYYYTTLELQNTFADRESTVTAIEEKIVARFTTLWTDDYDEAWDLYWDLYYYASDLEPYYAVMYEYAVSQKDGGDLDRAEYLLETLGDYSDSATLLEDIYFEQDLEDLVYYLDNGWYYDAEWLMDDYEGDKLAQMEAIYLTYAADSTFLTDLETAINTRLEMLENGSTYSEILDAEWGILEKYRWDVPFYDDRLEELSDDYFDAMYYMEYAEWYSGVDAMCYWNQGLAKTYMVLDDLNAEYGFGSGNATIESYLGTGETMLAYWEAYAAINDDFDWQCWWLSWEEDDLYYEEFYNATSYTFSVTFTGYTTDADGNVLTSKTSSFTWEPGEGDNVYIEIPDDYYSWDFSWEIYDIYYDGELLG